MSRIRTQKMTDGGAIDVFSFDFLDYDIYYEVDYVNFDIQLDMMHGS
jgi:hypothetical protein